MLLTMTCWQWADLCTVVAHGLLLTVSNFGCSPSPILGHHPLIVAFCLIFMAGGYSLLSAISPFQSLCVKSPTGATVDVAVAIDAIAIAVGLPSPLWKTSFWSPTYFTAHQLDLQSHTAHTCISVYSMFHTACLARRSVNYMSVC